MDYTISQYNDMFQDDWDDFVLNRSVNGTFLQTRRFLNYHKKNKFDDSSLIVKESNGEILAVLPACTVIDGDNKIYFSHKGSTYGGVIICKKIVVAEILIELIQRIEKYLIQNGFTRIVLKNTPHIFCKEKDELLSWVLFYLDYQEEKELNIYIDYSGYKSNEIENLSNGKRRNINKCEKAGLICREINNESEITKFYEILKISLAKYNLEPIHTLDDLLLLKNIVLKNECMFFGIFLGDEMIAGSMMFLFENVRVAHSQYLAALPEYNKLSPSSFLYYSMIKEIKKLEYNYLSWGISTEHGGKIINMGLTHNKESYGSKHTINSVYVKKLLC